MSLSETPQDGTSLSFEDRQRLIVEAHSIERKKMEKERLEMNERDYWAYMRGEEDRMSDGSDEQGWDKEENVNEQNG